MPCVLELCNRAEGNYYFFFFCPLIKSALVPCRKKGGDYMSEGFPKTKGLNANICDVSVQLARLEKT